MESKFLPIPQEVEEVCNDVIECAFRVHRKLGPGLLESVYETCLCYELTLLNRSYQRQLPIPIIYGDVRIDNGFRLDLLVENCVIVDLKACEKLIPLYEAQLLTYMKLCVMRLGLIINFNVPLLKDGIKRFVL